jgi:hypothetical protein
MRRPFTARNNDIDVQWRRVQVMDSVASKMSDIGRNDESPLSGINA